MPKKSVEEMQAELDALKAENEKLKAKGKQPFRLAVGSKGGLSVYGLQRFPVTLYKEQWLELLGHADEITEFIAAHASELKEKE